MGKNVAVFVDVANIFYAAKAAGVDIDYVTLLKSATAGRDFVRAYAYTGLDPDNENQRNFHSFLARHGYKVVSKDIRKYGDGKVKANLDIELVVDMMKTARNLDVAVVISGDGDFAPAIRAVQEMGVRVEVISFRGNTSSDLIEVADLFTDITHIAKVEKGSSRSGRRVADDDEDLSMTEVPDKQTEGPSRGRGRGRGRGRDQEPVAATRGRARTARRPEAEVVAEAPTSGSRAGLVALPGEKLSKAAAGSIDIDIHEEEGAAPEELVVAGPIEAGVEAGVETDEQGPRRRRRRRGGRGRGRGRSADGLVAAEEAEAPVDVAPDDEEEEAEAERLEPVGPAPVSTRPAARVATFGSVWDSQIGMPSAPSADLGGGSAADEDFDEPEIPEYLIAEQRRGARTTGGRGPRPGGGRGGRSAYVAAVERERYGGGRGAGGLNRYPDVSGRTGRPERSDRPDRGPRQDRGPRPDRGAPRPSSDEPWSEVPPELEEMLRAQLAAKTSRPGPAPEAVTEPSPTTAVSEEKPKRRTTTRKAAEPAALSGPAEPSAAAAEEKPKRRTTTRKAAASPTTAVSEEKPKRRTTTRKAAEPAASSGPAELTAAAAAEKPKRRTTTRKAADA